MGYDIYFREMPHADATGIAAVGYFRRNIWGMGPLREAMADAGMGYWSPSGDGIRFPTPNDFTDDEAFQAALEPVLSHHPDDHPGVPLHKLCTNDGWIITPDECAQAWTAFEQFSASDDLSRFADKMETNESIKEFAEFLKAAAECGGARVY